METHLTNTEISQDFNVLYGPDVKELIDSGKLAFYMTQSSHRLIEKKRCAHFFIWSNSTDLSPPNTSNSY